MIRAAGILFLTNDNRALLLRRSGEGDHQSEWCFPGGTTEGDESAEQTAMRETIEEIGLLPEGSRLALTRRIAEGVDFTTFLQKVPEEFTPTLNDEHDAFAWVDIAEVFDVGKSGAGGGADQAAGFEAEIEEEPEIAGYDDDADFVEGEHPRAPDGKFSKAGGTSGAVKHGIELYGSSLKKGAQGSSTGLIKHLLATGDYSANDMFAAAQAIYDLEGSKKSYVHTFASMMKKQGKVVPAIPKVSKVGAAPAEDEPFGDPEQPAYDPNEDPNAGGDEDDYDPNQDEDLEEKQAEEKAAAAKPSPHPPTPPVEIKPIPAPTATDITKDQFTSLAKQGLPPEAQAIIQPVIDHFDKLSAENKPLVVAKMQEIAAAKAKGESINTITPVQGMGQSISAFNAAISAAQASAPLSPKQQKVYAALTKAPHSRTEHTNYYEDAGGVETRSVLKTNTKSIPKDYYAKVSAAYAGNRSDGNTPEVGTAMQQYGSAIRETWSADEQAAANSYKGTGYYSMNAALLGKEVAGPETAKKNATLEALIAKSVIPADTPVWRGMNCDLKDLSGFTDAAHSVGRIFEHKNFASVSRSRGVSSGFGQKVLMRVVLPAGCNGLVLGKQNDGEKEIVLPARGVFRIDKVLVMDGGQGHEIEATYMGVREDG